MLTLFHDFTSPASAVAVARVQRLADEGFPVEFVGFEAVGIDAVLPPTIDVLANVDRLAVEAGKDGVILRRPIAVPPTALAHVVGTVADTAGLGASWRWNCYTAFWRDASDIGNRDVLADLAGRAGLGSEEVATALHDRRLLADTRRRTAAHRHNGVGGVPTILCQRTLVPGLLPETDLRALAIL
ncbi:MAG: DsbA family protein [Actinomycetota bacterium]|jgi:predicted DsbA family dithiol-disulfide isomerase|nr:DsbA family protein [Actinomycetota bacterium]